MAGFNSLALQVWRKFHLKILMVQWSPFKHQNALACSMWCRSERGGSNMMLKENLGVVNTLLSLKHYNPPCGPGVSWILITCEKGNIIILRHSQLAFSDKHAYSTEMEGTRVNASWSSPSNMFKAPRDVWIISKTSSKFMMLFPVWGHEIDRKQCILHINSFDQSPSMFINKAAQMYKWIKRQISTCPPPPLLQTCTKGNYM